MTGTGNIVAPTITATLEDRKKLVDALELESINLKEFHAENSVVPFLVTPTNSRIDAKISHRWQLDQQSSLLICYLEGETTGFTNENFPGIGKDNQLFKMKIVFCGFYRVRGTLPEPADFDWFAQSNATFNLYPYLRECLDGTSRRMGIPGIIMPLFRSNLPRPVVETKKTH